MKHLVTILNRTILVCTAVLLAAVDSGVPVIAAPVDPNDKHKGDLYYYTQNGIFFYEGGLLHCGTKTISGGAAGVLEAQTKLDKKWITVILTEAQTAGADPIAMASLLFWEHRGFPAYGAGPAPGESDSVGRGPWQIIKGSWPDWAGDYMTGVYDPLISTKVAADYVKRNGGTAGSPIGSIDQDFSKAKNLPSMATVAKNYNAGQGTWREPAIASYKQGGRIWRDSRKIWDDSKKNIIDDYILGMTYAYYLIATKTAQLGNVNTGPFVQEALTNAEKIKAFSFGKDGTESGGNVSNTCGAGEGNGNIVLTAFGLAWPNRKYDSSRRGQYDAKSYAKQTYQEAMPRIQGDATANDVSKSSRCMNCTAWTDCGVFVATTIRLSGADPDYQKRGTAAQLPYLVRNSNPSDPNRKYDLFRDFNNVSQVKPGDIFIVSGGNVGHTFIFTGEYTGDDKKTYDSASASWGDRVPMAAHAYFIQSGYHYVIARLRVNTGGDQP